MCHSFPAIYISYSCVQVRLHRADLIHMVPTRGNNYSVVVLACNNDCGYMKWDLVAWMARWKMMYVPCSTSLPTYLDSSFDSILVNQATYANIFRKIWSWILCEKRRMHVMNFAIDEGPSKLGINIIMILLWISPSDSFHKFHGLGIVVYLFILIRWDNATTMHQISSQCQY